MDFDIDRKRVMLPEFYTYLHDPDYSFAGCTSPTRALLMLDGTHATTRSAGGKADEQELLVHFYHVTRAFQALDPKFQPVILDITKRMGEGMCEFINKMRVSTLQEWDTYCYYVRPTCRCLTEAAARSRRSCVCLVRLGLGRWIGGRWSEQALHSVGSRRYD